MKLRLIYCLLFILPAVYAGETGYSEPAQAEAESDEIKNWRKLISENPELEKLLQENLDKRSAESGKEKQETPAEVETQAKVRDFTPSSEAADDAYKKGDYETALKHYEALGEDGDSRASMAAGLIHAEGVGDIEVDNAKAVAWLKRSGDQGETVGAELYENIDEKEELSEDEKLKAENLIREFQASDAKLMKDQKTSPTKSISSGNYSSISGTGLPQYSSKSEFVQISEVNSYTVSNDIGASFSPTRSNSGDYSYRPGKVSPEHYLPERE